MSQNYPALQLLTVQEAAQILACSPKALRRRIERRQLPIVRLGGRVLVLANDIRALIEAGRQEANGPNSLLPPRDRVRDDGGAR